jgi:hypothetical protein
MSPTTNTATMTALPLFPGVEMISPSSRNQSA